MTTLSEAAQQALEALEMCRLNGSQYLYGNERDLVFSAIKALRAALAQQAKPLRMDKVEAIYAESSTTPLEFARAIERAHGIK